MSGGSSRLGGLSRRSVLKGAAATGGLAMSQAFPYAPAIAQARVLRAGVFGGDFGNLSPVVRHDIQGGLIVYNVFDGLVRINFETREILPWLAEDWTNSDPLTWRIKLREGVRWQRDYGEFTAEDVVYSWNYHIESRSWQVGTAFFPVENITAESRYVLEVKTRAPFGAFPGVTMGYGGLIACARAHQEMGNDAYSAAPIGHGPFMVDAVRGNEVELVRHPEYWRQGYPKLDAIQVRAIPDSAVRLQALFRGELDYMTHPDPKDVAGARANPDYTTVSTAGWNWDYQQFNLRADNGLPYHNKLVRQAISYAIDREAIVQEIYNGEATITDNQIPPGYLGHRESLVRYPKNGDLAKARELMAQAGATGYEVEVITSDKDWLRRELELVAAMVSQIGINYRIRNLDIGGFNNLWLNKNFEQHLEDITLVAPDPDATSWWFLHSAGASSASLGEIDHLLDGARSELDPGAREGTYHQIVDWVVDDCQLIYHCNVNYVQVFRNNVRGFTPTPQEYLQLHDTTELA